MLQMFGRSGRSPTSPSSPSSWSSYSCPSSAEIRDCELPVTTSSVGVKVLADILLAIDRGNLAGLALLDLSAAFHTVGHDVLLQRLLITYGIDCMAWMWFRFYLPVRQS